MRACVINGTGSLEHVEVAEVPAPGAGGLRTHEVRVALRAAALNHLDLFVVRGLPHPVRYPHVVGADGAGVVDAVGDSVIGVSPGDGVMINPTIADGDCEACRRGEHSLCRNLQVLGEHLPGTFAEYLVVPESNVARIPQVTPALSWSEAAAFSLVTLTAWRMLITKAQVQPGETVLIWGIGGGVSLAALQIARLWGARCVVTSSSDEKLARAVELGADAAFNHTRDDIVRELRAWTEGRGVDVVIDNVGQATWERSLRVLARGGRLVCCGATSGAQVGVDLRHLFWKQLSILGSTLGNLREYAAAVGALGRGELRPVVDEVFALQEARAALERLQRGEQLGKIVLQVSE